MNCALHQEVRRTTGMYAYIKKKLEKLLRGWRDNLRGEMGLCSRPGKIKKNLAVPPSRFYYAMLDIEKP